MRAVNRIHDELKPRPTDWGKGEAVKSTQQLDHLAKHSSSNKKGVLQRLLDPKAEKTGQYLFLEICEAWRDIHEIIDVILVWCPGHQGIVGNEAADLTPHCLHCHHQLNDIWSLTPKPPSIQSKKKAGSVLPTLPGKRNPGAFVQLLPLTQDCETITLQTGSQDEDQIHPPLGGGLPHGIRPLPVSFEILMLFFMLYLLFFLFCFFLFPSLCFPLDRLILIYVYPPLSSPVVFLQPNFEILHLYVMLRQNYTKKKEEKKKSCYKTYVMKKSKHFKKYKILELSHVRGPYTTHRTICVHLSLEKMAPLSPTLPPHGEKAVDPKRKPTKKKRIIHITFNHLYLFFFSFLFFGGGVGCITTYIYTKNMCVEKRVRMVKKKIWGQCMRERETKGKEPSYGQETRSTIISTPKEERYVHGE
ncbi:uncharacterized protein VP01_1199g1 [Puccinia sorghi]|uniref:RNase H type-1 domain-containing protein n=1 Tax=Puccinia sorghi TaxID=27349 RepID=A0A0L6VQM9_9BASI|nr:uncharacterized protein VP01_1199g1 [Puccinia sorghi]